MQITFLGTSAGMATRERSLSGMIVKNKISPDWYLVDCGGGTLLQLSKTKHNLHKLKAIFITHMHGDHCYELPSIIANMGAQARVNKLCLIGPKNLKPFIENIIRLTDLYINYEIEFIDCLDINYLTGDRFETNNFVISSIELSHRIESFAYIFDDQKPPPKLDIDKLEKDGIPKGPIWGQIVRNETMHGLNANNYILYTNFIPKRLIIAGDNDKPELLTPVAKNISLLIHEATYTEEVKARLNRDSGHSCAKEVAIFAERLGIKSVVLTHFSPRYLTKKIKKTDLSIEQIKEEMIKYYKGQAFLAKDLTTYEIIEDKVISTPNII